MHAQDPEFQAHLVDLCSIADCQRGATWLLKHDLGQTKASLPDDLSQRHLSTIHQILHWEARLHILQYLERLSLPETAKSDLSRFVEEAISADNKLVRAWGFYGLAILAVRFPDLAVNARRVLQQAQSTETAGSVKVRIRKGLEKLGH